MLKKNELKPWKVTGWVNKRGSEWGQQENKLAVYNKRCPDKTKKTLSVNLCVT